MGRSITFLPIFLLVFLPTSASAININDSVIADVTWFVENQEVNGSWDGGLFWSTTEAVQALQNQNYMSASRTIDYALNWVQGQSIDGTDFLSREILLSQRDLVELGPLQNADGGWGYNRHYTSNVFDTSIALRALTVGGRDASAVEKGVLYLKGLQGLDGSYSVDGMADYAASAIASESLGRSAFLVANGTLLFNEEAYRAGYESFYFLRENNAKLEGNPLIAHALTAALYNGYAPEFRNQLVKTLLENQNVDGGWGVIREENGSAYSTAASLLALEEYQAASLGLEVTSIELRQDGSTINPGLLKAGEEYRVSARVSNPTPITQEDIILVGKVVKDGTVIGTIPPQLIPVFESGSTRTPTLDLVTHDLPSGESLLEIELRDKKGRVVHAREQELNVLPTKKVRISRLSVEPGFADIKSTVVFYVGLENTGNQRLSNASIVVEVLLPNQTRLWSANKTTSLDAGEEKYLGVGALYTAGLGYGDYVVVSKVLSDDAQVDGGLAYSSLSIGPRVSVSRDINESKFPSGPSTTRVNITMVGETGRPPADIVILVDNTNASGLGDVKNALALFAGSLKEGDRIAVLAVSDTVHVLQDLTTDKKLVSDAITSVTPGASELYLGAGINASVGLLLGEGGYTNNWYIFTVARSPSYDDPLGAVEYAADHGIPVYLIIYAEGDVG